MSESRERMASLTRRRALRIVAALRQGSNCLEGVSTFSAGRALLMRAAEEELDELELTNAATVRWIKGRYGHGKTHTFARLMELAHDRNWVTSYCQIRLQGQGLELARFNEVYAAIVRNCLCKGMIEEDDGQVTPGRRSGWEWILDQWWRAIRRQAGAESGDIQTFRLQDTISHVLAGMQQKWGITGSFCEALRQYAISRMESEGEWTSVIGEWFMGEDVHARGGDTRRRLRASGIRESLNKRNAKELLRCLSAFVRYRGFGGIMVLLDEVENVLQGTRKSRREAYTILRELIDNVDDRHGMVATTFYAAGTPDLFDGEKGFTEYEALAERVLLPGRGGSPNPRAPLLDLTQFPLQRRDFVEMGQRVVEVYSIAKQIEPPDAIETRLSALLDELLARNPDTSARNWVRQVVNVLDTESQPA